MRKTVTKSILRGLEQAVAYARGAADRSRYRVHVPQRLDVRAIRAKLGMTQEEFAGQFGFSVNALRHWEHGKRRLDREGERWTRVRIEFEQASRNFKDHGHDPSGCDLIVCWHHNWAECPIEVLELSKIVHEIDRRHALAQSKTIALARA